MRPPVWSIGLEEESIRFTWKFNLAPTVNCRPPEALLMVGIRVIEYGMVQRIRNVHPEFELPRFKLGSSNCSGALCAGSSCNRRNTGGHRPDLSKLTGHQSRKASSSLAGHLLEFSRPLQRTRSRGPLCPRSNTIKEFFWRYLNAGIKPTATCIPERPPLQLDRKQVYISPQPES